MVSKSQNGTEKYIYFSGAENDARKINPLLITLREAGCNIRYDNDADNDTIREHIENCSYFMAYVTEAYVGSEKCMDELELALQLGKKLLMIYGEDTALPKGMQMRINRVQAIYRSKYPELYEFYAKVLQTEAVRECGGTHIGKDNGDNKTYAVEYDDTKALVKGVLKIVGWFVVASFVLMTIMQLVV